MKVVLAIAELRQRLEQLGAVIARKSQDAVYRNVHIYTEEGAVYLQGVDVDTTMTLKLTGAKIEEEGSILTEYEKFRAIVSGRRSDFVLETMENNQAVISNVGVRARALLGTSPSDKFTALGVIQGLNKELRPSAADQHVFGLPGLKEQIELVEYAIPPAGGKFVVPSILLDSAEGKLTLVATDGVRMAISTKPDQSLAAFSFTMPKATLDLLKKLDGGGEATVRISENDNAFFIETKAELVTYNKTHSKFPPYKKIAPGPNTQKTTLVFKDKDAFLEMLTTLTPQCDDQEHPRISYTSDATGKEVLCVATKEEKQSTGNVYFDTGEHMLQSEGSGALPFAIALDAKVLNPFIQAATFPIVMHFTSVNGVVDMHIAGGTKEAPTYRFLQMPMRDTHEAGATSIPIPVSKKK
jgi:DNA polymerase III subunit beta